MRADFQESAERLAVHNQPTRLQLSSTAACHRPWMSHTKRYFEMLGAAYEVPSATDRFDAFLDSAIAYFFEGRENGALAEDVPRHHGTDDMLDTHGARISKLLDEALRREISLDERFHAVLKVSARAGRVTGNAAAAQLTGQGFPCALDELPLDTAALGEIRKTLRAPAHQAQDRIILANVEAPQIRPCLALIQRPEEADDQVHVSLSYIDWPPALMGRLREAFGLTASESEVLEGYLGDLSQKEIADQRGRALETIKGQSKSILRKTGCARMSDVVQLCASIAFLMRHLPERANLPAAAEWVTPKAGLALLSRPGRQLAWYRIGNGPQPVLFIHGYLQGPFFTPAFINRLNEAGLQLVAPSRPGFGYSSPSRSRSDFNETVVADALTLVDTLGIERISLCIHQGGASHGFRIAKALGDRLGAMLLVGGGIPIDETSHLSHMDRQTRFAAIASRHAPSVMKMVMSVGLPVYRKRGARAFLEKQFATAPGDLATLDDSVLFNIQAQGLYHAVEQGGEAWVRDGASAMADWRADFEAVNARQMWLQAQDDPVISAHQVAAYLEGRPNTCCRILPAHGVNILHTAIDAIMAELVKLD